MFDRFSVFIFFLGFSLFICAVSSSSVKCNKSHKTFSSLKFTLPSAEAIIICDNLCMSYACYNTVERKYILGSGCRNNFLKDCALNKVYPAAKQAFCKPCFATHNIIGLYCHGDDKCDKTLKECVEEAKKDAPYNFFGPYRHISDIKFN